MVGRFPANFKINFYCYIPAARYSMDKLNERSHHLFTESIIKTLNCNRISTVLEFLTEEVQKISTLTKLSIHNVIIIRCDFLSQFSAKIRQGDKLISDLSKFKFISTGMKSLDEILSGGILLGHITEICGLAGCGKTQLCITLAIHAAMHTEQSVLYIDTKGDFSAVSVQKYIENMGKSHEETAKIMELIKVVRVWHMTELVELLQQLKAGKINIKHLHLIIVDSLPCLTLQCLGDESKIGLMLLNKFVNIARYLCKETNLAVLCVNIWTRWVEQTAQDIEDPEAVSETNFDKRRWKENKFRCLGRYWQHIPALVLELETCSSHSTNTKSILATTAKSTIGVNGVTCYLKFSPIGVIEQ